MNKSELFEKIFKSTHPMSKKIIEKLIKKILEYMVFTLMQKKRIEIRGFGSFSLHYRVARMGRNPKTGKKVDIKERYVPFFKPGKSLKDKVNI